MLDYLMRILITPDRNILAIVPSAQVKCGLVSENNPCCHVGPFKFLLKVTGELEFVTWF
jgi:hypothetical protein